MGTVELSEPGRSGMVRVRNVNSGPGEWAKVADILIQSGATYDRGCLILERTAFRIAVQSLARVSRSMRVRLVYDDAIRHLLETHLSEARDLKLLREQEPEPHTQDIEALLMKDPDWVSNESLKGYQLENISLLQTMKNGANFSVPGAGKTRTALALYRVLKVQGAVDRLLIVCPKGAFASWEDEGIRCIRGIRCSRLVGGLRLVREALAISPEIALVTYQMLPNALQTILPWVTAGHTHLILDEAHRIKAGAGGLFARACLRLSDFAVRRDILTGTPVPNSVGDLMPQFEFLWPGQGVVPMFSSSQPETEKIRTAQSMIKCLYVRTTKQELGLPPVTIRKIEVPMGPLQTEIYEALRSQYREEIGTVEVSDRRRFRALGRQSVRLLQAATNPELILNAAPGLGVTPKPIPQGSRLWDLCEHYSTYESPAKILAAVTRAEELSQQGRKCVIWSSFVSNVELVAKRLENLGALFLHGQVPTSRDQDTEDTREDRIRRFHEDPNCWVLVANPAAAGEGISLHRVCHNALYIDRTFNAAHYLQSLDRIHRLGLASDVETVVEVLYSPETIEEAVEVSLKRKTLAMAAILEDHGLARLAYDPEDVAEIVPGGLDQEDIFAILEHLQRTKR